MEQSPNIHTVPMRDRVVLSSIDATLKEYWAEQLKHAQRAVEVATSELRIIEDSELAMQGIANETERLKGDQNGGPTEPSKSPTPKI